jgi:hypothetical protein
VKGLATSDPARGRLYLIDFDLAEDARLRCWTKGGWMSNPMFGSRFHHMDAGTSPSAAAVSAMLM